MVHDLRAIAAALGSEGASCIAGEPPREGWRCNWSGVAAALPGTRCLVFVVFVGGWVGGWGGGGGGQMRWVRASFCNSGACHPRRPSCSMHRLAF